jgi:hypothetical protein
MPDLRSLRIAEHATMAGMLLGRLDPKRRAIICTPDNLRGKVQPRDLLVATSELSASAGAAGEPLVAWIVRGRVAGVVWFKGPDQVRYLEGRPADVLAEAVRRVMHAERWD